MLGALVVIPHDYDLDISKITSKLIATTFTVAHSLGTDATFTQNYVERSAYNMVETDLVRLWF